MVQEAPEYLTWQSADRMRTVRVRHDVIRGIHIEIMRGFGVTRRRGTEPGGVLLGHAENDVLVIDGFEVAPCEYAFGPSFVLSAHDEAEFASVLAWTGASAVDYFRSHTRDGLSPDQADADLFSKFLPESGRLVLLLKPFATRPPAASFFFPLEGGRLRPGAAPHEFAFSTKLESVIAEPDAESEPAAPLPEPELAPVPPDPPRLLVSVPKRRRENDRVLSGVLGLRRPAGESTVEPDGSAGQSPARGQRDFLTLLAAILFTAAALGTGFIAGFQLAGGHMSLRPPSIAGVDPRASFGLGLRTAAAGDRVRVQWATDSAAARIALSGTLYIRDGNETQVVNLHPDEVRDGVILHLPQTGSARFRLELILPGDRTVTEAVDWKR